MLSLTVNGLTKKFGSVLAVDDLTFTVSPGKVTGFMGPNGAGKTTTMRALLGLVAPTAGTALVNNQKYEDLRQPMFTVGSHLDPQDFNPGHTGTAHMRIVAAGGGTDAKRIPELLELVGLTGAANRRVGGYSLGMRQRLGLASALLGDPQILILDEPANGLDPEGITWLRHFLRAFAEEGKIVFLSSHLLTEVQQVATDVIIINDGRLVASGSVEELERAAGARVMVDANDRELLVHALRAARMQPTGGGPFTVTGVDPSQVGHVALAAGVPLTHLTQKVTDLEELFMEKTGNQQAPAKRGG